MTTQDESELLRLTKILETIHREVGSDPLADEALRKAALALHVSFIHGLRPKVEEQFEKLGQPLTDSEKQWLQNLGIEPD